MVDAARNNDISPLSFSHYHSQLQIAVLKATRNAAVLPGDIAFYTSMGKDLAQEAGSCSSRVITLTNRLLDLVATGESSSTKGKKRAHLTSREDVQDSFRSIVVDSMDQLLERTDMKLDEVRGLLKPSAITVTTGSQPDSQKQTSKRIITQGRLDPALQNASHLPKPQIQFKQKVNNANQPIWHHLLRHKYNAQVPLGYRMSGAGVDADDLTVTSLHPYHHEINHIPYPSQLFQYSEPILPKSFDDTPFVWIDTPELFSTLLDTLRNAREIAIDLEHHSYRTFSGFVCLMQISTRDSDYIVDTLALREELEDLNEVFTDPKILKVLHGAESDIVWLQRDFNLYIVNMFDTFHASKVLSFPRHGLATLLEMYCDFTPDKRYQLADWRIRPLPEEMLDYARSDTHYLLFIYDNLRNALLDRSGSRSNTPPDKSSSDGHPAAVLLREVLSRSEATCLRVYEQELYDEESGSGLAGWELLARKWNKAYLSPSNSQSSQRLAVYKTVHAWRDRVARLEDESTRYVLPNHFLFSLAEHPPADMASLHSLFPSIPPIIRARGKELLDAIRDCIKQIKPSNSSESTQDIPATKELGIVSSVDTAVPRAGKNPRANIFAPIAHLTGEYPSAQFSALFGSASNVDRSALQSSVFSSPRSSLFGFTSSMSSGKRTRSVFQDVLSRIHHDLSAAPTIPKRISQEDLTVIVKTERAPAIVEKTFSEQVEIAYVPSEKRHEPVPVVDDTIIVVGQNKRKRKSTRNLAGLKDSQASILPQDGPELDVIHDGRDTGVCAAVDTAPFDFEASGSNILDDGSDHETEDRVSRTKKHKGGSGLFEYGDFKAPPKAHSQLQKGNISRTFK